MPNEVDWNAVVETAANLLSAQEEGRVLPEGFSFTSNADGTYTLYFPPGPRVFMVQDQKLGV